MRADILEYFESRIERIPESGCWIWMGGIYSEGYGSLKIEDRSDYAHRVSWRIHRGKIPQGMHVCHVCDVRPCVNPYHLFLGTNADNMADKVAKGRQTRGEAYGRKMRDAFVMEILASDEPGTVLAKRYGVSQALISSIRHGDRWAHLPRPDVITVRRVGRLRDENKRFVKTPDPD